ncbi:hypothetical protein [Streptomyces atratus]|uniref:hypothetical protein n=1 Tax=Streptomyces atratus TaxID=1893 RepID=UPI003401A419
MLFEQQPGGVCHRFVDHFSFERDRARTTPPPFLDGRYQPCGAGEFVSTRREHRVDDGDMGGV